MLRIYRFFKGFVKIKVSGEKPECIINLCMSEGYSVWDIERGNDGLVISILANDYIKLFSLRKTLPVRVKIKMLEKRGASFTFRKIKKRSGIAAGIALFLSINILLSSYIWEVKVIGNENIDENSILSVCNDNGLDIGVKRKEVDLNKLKQTIPINVSGIAWTSVNIEGSVASVNISESTESEKKDDMPANIIASRDGVIESIKVIEGKKVTEVGKAVSKGELLVSGIIETEENQKFLEAEGIILAETHRRYVYEIDKNLVFQNANGNAERRSIFYFFGLKIPLYLSKVSGTSRSYITEKYVTVSESKIPIGIIRRTFSLTDTETLEINKDGAENLALQKLCEEARNDEIISLKSLEVSTNEKSESFCVTVKAVFLENIAEKQLIITDSNS